MKWYKPRKEEFILFMIMMPFITTGANYLLFEERFLTWEVLIKSNLVMYPVGVMAWYTHVSVSHKINTHFSHYTRIKEKTLLLLILHVGVMASSFAVYFFGYDYFDYLDYHTNVERYVWAVIIFFFFTSAGSTIWRFTYTIQRWKEELAQNQQLQQENLQTELDSLKCQISPHYLYNSMTALSVLIEEDPPKAEAFVYEMSKIYRYVLKTHENGLSTLADELNFIRSYYFILKTRLNNCIELELQIAPGYLNHFLPAHTLHMLVENALKHNRTAKDSPLKISIETKPDGKLVVTNNLQPRQLTVHTNKTGLSNIRKKYKILSNQEVVILETENSFSVVLPLIGSPL